MSKGIRVPLAAADQLAASVVRELAPGCERLEVAGSIRRRKATVGDLEIVAIPKTRADLLGENPQSMLDPILADLCEAGRLVRIRGGEKQKQYKLAKAGILLDLFLVTPETWPGQLAVRTGPEEFSKRLVTPRSKGGMLPEGWRFANGFRLYDQNGKAVDVTEEHSLFEAIGAPWVEPEHR